MTTTTPIGAEAVKQLRELTGAGFMDCKHALEATDGDLERATALLREKGLSAAASKSGREAREGLVSSYIHTGGRIGVLIEVNCETDFVARTDEFQKLVRSLAIQVAGLAPEFVTVESIPADVLAAKREELLADHLVQGKPEAIRGQIVDGQLREVAAAGRPLRAAIPRHGPDRRRAGDGSGGPHRRAHPRAPLHPLRARGGAVSDAPAGVIASGPGASDKAGGPRYSRILLKISGEALLGDRQYGVDPAMTSFIAKQIGDVQAAGVEVAVVVGGGNIFRGMAAAARGMDRATGDYMGMLATVMNGLALQDALEKAGVQTRVMSAIAMNEVAEPYIRRRAVRHLEKGRVVIFAAGTGNPYFTTDTAAALRAVEIGAEVMLKATKVDGVYDADPLTHPDAIRHEHLTFSDVLQDRLQVLDATAVSLCMENGLPIVVFDLHRAGNIRRVALGEPVGTRIDGGPAA